MPSDLIDSMESIDHALSTCILFELSFCVPGVSDPNLGKEGNITASVDELVAADVMVLFVG